MHRTVSFGTSIIVCVLYFCEHSFLILFNDHGVTMTGLGAHKVPIPRLISCDKPNDFTP
jgi:hypothetical protein